jgi:hypothetical protein
MAPIVVFGVSIFVCALITILALAASLLAALIFRMLPNLEGTFLGLTGSDLGRAWRKMPTYPAWFPRQARPEQRPVKVMLALNPTGGHPEYLKAFDQTDKLLFTSDRRSALQFDSSDAFVLQTIRRRLEDNSSDLFLVLAQEAGIRRNLQTNLNC